jgi:hypothetical protein
MAEKSNTAAFLVFAVNRSVCVRFRHKYFLESSCHCLSTKIIKKKLFFRMAEIVKWRPVIFKLLYSSQFSTDFNVLMLFGNVLLFFYAKIISKKEMEEVFFIIFLPKGTKMMKSVEN